MVSHFVCVLFVGYIIYVAKPGSSLFSWHPALMALGFGFMLSEAILVFSPQSSFLVSATRKTRVFVHWTGAVAALSCVLIGLATVWWNKELRNKSHATTWHGILGYATVAYLAVQCCAGAMVKYPSVVKNMVRLADLKMYHATSGLTLFALGCVSLVLGMYSNYFNRLVTGTSWYACVGCVAFLALIMANQVTSAYLKKPAPVAKK